MAQSGFNQGQTGNASEVGAGVVKLATQVQIDNGDASDGGVPLVVTPDKIAGKDVMTGFLANEAIAVGDAVAQYKQSYTQSVFQSQLTDNSEQPFNPSNSSTWYAQKFTTPADLARLKRVTVKCRIASGVSSLQFQGKIRETLAGADITTFNLTPAVLNGQTTVTGADNLARVLSPSTEYYLMILIPNPAGFGTWIRTATSPTADTHKSVNSGVTWAAEGGYSFYLELEEDIDSTPEGSIGLASAATFDSPINFLGFATAAANIGESVSYDFGTITTIVGASLTPLQDYWLSDTPGQVSASQGTIERYIGKAISATQIARKRGTVSNLFGQGSPLGGVPVDCIFVGDAGSATDQQTVGIVTTKGDRALSRLVRRLETFSGGGSQRLQIFDSGSPF